VKFSLNKNIEIPEDSIELMLGGRSSSKDDKMIVFMVRSLEEVREETCLKYAQKIK
jgi:hypothetical protein